MKRWKIPLMMIFLVAGLTSAIAQQVMFVQSKTAPLKMKPMPLGALIVNVPYGSTVTILEKVDASWYKVQYGNYSGYLHSSTLTKNKNALTSTSGSANVTNDDLANAGKGFSQEVENKYKEEQGLDFSGVDAMEKYLINEWQMSTFLTNGALSGAQQ